jgi:uncharacterized phage protein (TIGR01671 family)
MKDIKFRYWDPFNETMIYNYQFQMLSDFFEEHDKALYGGNNPTLMQFTGLQDTNGRDIYEGDLVTCEPSKIIRKIIFHNGCFKLESAGGLILNNLGSYIEFNNVQIIGNIYETAETEEK